MAVSWFSDQMTFVSKHVHFLAPVSVGKKLLLSWKIIQPWALDRKNRDISCSSWNKDVLLGAIDWVLVRLQLCASSFWCVIGEKLIQGPLKRLENTYRILSCALSRPSSHARKKMPQAWKYHHRTRSLPWLIGQISVTFRSHLLWFVSSNAGMAARLSLTLQFLKKYSYFLAASAQDPRFVSFSRIWRRLDFSAMTRFEICKIALAYYFARYYLIVQVENPCLQKPFCG